MHFPLVGHRRSRRRRSEDASGHGAVCTASARTPHVEASSTIFRATSSVRPHTRDSVRLKTPCDNHARTRPRGTSVVDLFSRSHTTDDELLQIASTHVADERSRTAELLADLAEIDARKLH